jgi:hypothetical protein
MPNSIAFDVDGTLIWQEGIVGEIPDTPRYDVINLFNIFEKLHFEMYVWSGGGLDYAQRWCNKLGLRATVVEKASFRPDIAVDDQFVDLGKVNIKV